MNALLGISLLVHAMAVTEALVTTHIDLLMTGECLSFFCVGWFKISV
jgi:hypothetical protein